MPKMEIQHLYLIDPVTRCWNYTGVLKDNGYGQHRHYYEVLTNTKVAKGMTLDHLCKNKICVNPEHLEVVSLKENIRRGSQTKLSVKDVSFIRTVKNWTQKQLASKFSVHQSEISKIINNKRYVT